VPGLCPRLKVRGLVVKGKNNLLFLNHDSTANLEEPFFCGGQPTALKSSHIYKAMQMGRFFKKK
jgi:hypothetical protein